MVLISTVADHSVVVMLPAPHNDMITVDHNMCRSKPIPDHSRRGVQRSVSLLLPLLVARLSLSACSTEPEDLQSEVYPEDQQPYFETCLARHDGTYHERELQQHRLIGTYEEPAPDLGTISDECVARE